MPYELKVLMKKKFLHFEYTRKNCSKSRETKENHVRTKQIQTITVR